MTDIIGGRSRAYMQALEKARQFATEEMVARATAMKANAVIGVDIYYEVFGEGGVDDNVTQWHSCAFKR